MKFSNADGENLVQANITDDVIRFGNGVGDFVLVFSMIDDSAIQFGNGAGDFVRASFIHGSSSIQFGNGAGDHVVAGIIINSSFDVKPSIDFGNGGGDFVIAQAVVLATINFGNGAGDFVLANDIRGTSINLGNGAGDYVSAAGPDSGNNNIALGNGANDVVNLSGDSHGGNYIAMGSGAGNMVTVGPHNSPDTFAFALGTDGTHFTTVTGAQGGATNGDQVVVKGGELGNTLVPVATSPSETFAQFISSIASPTKGNTYVGNNGTDTFIFTDTQGGTGAIDIVGVHTASITNHVLTLTS